MHPLERGIRLPRATAEAPGRLPPQQRVTIPLQWGETALVQVGETVLLGQRIADGSGDTVPVHASVSGTVAAIAPRTCADGRRHPAIVLQNDGAEQWDSAVCARALLDDLSDELLLNTLFEAGIRLPDGMPLASAIADAGPGVQMLIISAMDPEPSLCTEDAVLAFDTEAALSGIRVLERLLRPQNLVLAVGAGQKAAIRAAERWIGQRLRLAVTPDVYPAGHPRRLAELIGGLQPGQTAREGGVLVLPVSAAAAAGRSAYEGLPVVEQLVCISWGDGHSLLKAPLGAPVSAVLRAAGHDGGLVLAGGPMTGVCLDNLSVPVVKGLSGLTLLPRQAAPRQTACIRCGRCAAVCPAGLQPWQSQCRRARRDWNGCLRCGACQYSCPAGLPLLQAMGRRGREVAGVG